MSDYWVWCLDMFSNCMKERDFSDFSNKNGGWTERWTELWTELIRVSQQMVV